MMTNVASIKNQNCVAIETDFMVENLKNLNRLYKEVIHVNGQPWQIEVKKQKSNHGT